ncbi:RagB/SusD family nutrient uptake outer membrane protein [Bacteroides fragilis]
MKKTIFLSTIILLLTACQDYLETNPDSTFDVQIDSEDKIAELLAGAYPEASYFAFLEARTDNVGERTNGIHSRLNEAMYYWEDYDQEVYIDEGEGREWEILYPHLGVKRNEK